MGEGVDCLNQDSQDITRQGEAPTPAHRRTEKQQGGRAKEFRVADQGTECNARLNGDTPLGPSTHNHENLLSSHSANLATVSQDSNQLWSVRILLKMLLCPALPDTGSRISVVTDRDRLPVVGRWIPVENVASTLCNQDCLWVEGPKRVRDQILGQDDRHGIGV